MTRANEDDGEAGGIRARKREAILAAGLELFRRYGFRKASIDAIAAEAQVAKPTVYAHFADKEALFVAVCARLFEGVLASAERAAKGDAPVAERLAAVLEAKFTLLYEVVHASPHAAELIGSQGELARDIVREADERYAALLTRAVASAAKAGELDLAPLAARPSEVAQLLMMAAHGARWGARTAADHRRNIARLTRALLLSALPPAPAPKARR